MQKAFVLDHSDKERSMEAESWGEPKKRIQPPWEDFAAPSSSSYDDAAPPTSFRRSMSFSGSFFHPPHSDYHSHLTRSSSSITTELDPWRRQSLSGPLESFQNRSGEQMKRLSMSGPLPSTNPYLSRQAMPQEEDVPPLRTLPPWSEFRQSGNGFGLPLSSSSPRVLPSSDGNQQQKLVAASMQLVPASPRTSSRTAGENNRGVARKAKLPVSPSITRSASTRQHASNGHSSSFARSLSFDATDGHKQQQQERRALPVVQQQLTKARSLADGVVESLLRQLVGVSEGSNLLTDTIFSSSTHLRAGDSHASTRSTVERILLVQLHALTSILMGIALDPAEFDRQKWILRGGSSTREDHPPPPEQEKLCNDGSRLLCLKKHFVECGLEAFDVLAAVQDLLPHLGGSEKNSESVMRIATFGGGPGCTALAVCLFFLHLLPGLASQVDIVTPEERWQALVDAISLKQIGIQKADLLDVIKHPSMLRGYRILVFMNSLGESFKAGGWDAFWNDVYQNTNASVVVIVFERNVCWDDMKPKKGSQQWWSAAAPGKETVHLVRKM